MNAPAAPKPAAADSGWQRLAPPLFVVLWSSGFIGALYGLPYAEPLTLLGYRFALVAAIMLLLALALRAPWPTDWRGYAHIAIVGLLIHGVYLGCVFIALDRGVSAGVAALIVGMQPLVTATAVALLLRERVSVRQWLGSLLGFTGLMLVVGRQVSLSGSTAFDVGLCVIALGGITAGTLYQKRFCGAMDLRTGSFIQYLAAGVLVLLGALWLESMEVQWTAQFVFALVWLALVLSIGAVLLLYVLIRRGTAVRVTSLFYLVPPTTAAMAWVLFGETLGPLALAGMVIAVAGVAMVNR